jgi:methylated-DNA-[protein]-cysteine S-methyltransferase
MTSFTKKVYKAVLKIPFGEVRTYKWVAKKIGHPQAYRAVGNTLNKNPWPIIVPCHRVVASGGKLGGFSQGINKKKRLLELERKIKQLLMDRK